jgi:fructose-1-phosphate kinase PfkB-like protein
MKKIITLTVNPALDKSITVPELVPDKKLRASEGKTEPGGGGVNISRALKKLGAESEAVYFSGGYPGRHFDALLEAEGVHTKPLFIQEDTRENFIVVNKATGHNTALVWKALRSALQKQTTALHISGAAGWITWLSAAAWHPAYHLLS